jgi:hypothetical protein
MNTTEQQIEQQEQADFTAAVAGEPVEVVEHTQDPVANPLEETAEQLLERFSTRIENTFNNRLRTVEGTIGNLKQTVTAFSVAAKTAEQQGSDAPNAKQMQEAAISGAKLKQLKEEFPEWAEAIEETRDLVMKQMPDVDKYRVQIQQLEQRAQQLSQDSVRNAYLARQMARLDMTHPDWEQTIRSTPYQNWLRTQPNEIQALTQSENAVDALRVLDSYVAHAEQSPLTAQSRQSSNRRLSSAIAPTGGRTPVRSIPQTEHEAFLAAFKS